jgi:hypothetical protein
MLRHPEGLTLSRSNVGKVMKLKRKLYLGSVAFAGALFFAPFSGAQQKQTSAVHVNVGYDLSRETTIQGTVVSYIPASSALPLGAHVTIRTASGNMDVHLGNPYLLKRIDIFLAPGDSIRIVGETQPYGAGTFFAARVLTKGSQTVLLRNLKGLPMSPAHTANATGLNSQTRGAQ